MALAEVTGRLGTFARQAIPSGMTPVLRFKPSVPGVGQWLHTAELVTANLFPSGNFTASLEETDAISPPGFHYTAEVTYYRAGAAVRTDSFWRTPIYVPLGGGDISTFPGIPLTLASLRVQLVDPRLDEPAFKGYWMQAAPGNPDNGTDTGTGNVYRIF